MRRILNPARLPIPPLRHWGFRSLILRSFPLIHKGLRRARRDGFAWCAMARNSLGAGHDKVIGRILAGKLPNDP